MPRPGLAFALLAAIAFHATGAEAQRVGVTLAPGTRVRVTTAPPSRRLDGRVVEMTADSLFLGDRGSGTQLRVAIGELRTLEVRGGEDKRRGMAIGGGIGFGITAVFGGIDHARGEIGTGELIGATLTNALIGMLIGYAFAPTGWEGLPLPGR